MNKKTILIAAVILAILAAGILFFLPRNESLFDGERDSKPGRFSLRFDRMNSTDSETMALEAGDWLHVSWQIESGRADIVIAMEGEEPVYRAADRAAGDEADFSVEIPKAGAYTITVSAREAKGQIAFLRTKME